MDNSEKIQRALDLIREVRGNIKDNTILQMFLDEDITRLERIKAWIENK